MRLLQMLIGAAACAGGVADAQRAGPGLPADAGSYLGPANYPPLALRNKEQGRVVAALRVDARGHVTACDVRQSSGSWSLDMETCRIARERIIFTPARDAQGRAVAGDYILPVRWALPDDAARPLAEWTLVTRFSTDGQGRMTACRPDGSGPVPPVAAEACADIDQAPKAAERVLAGRGNGGVLLTAMRPGSIAPAMPPGRWRTVAASSAALIVGPDGTVERCSAGPRTGLARQLPSPCVYGAGPFVGDGQRRTAMPHLILATAE